MGENTESLQTSDPHYPCWELRYPSQNTCVRWFSFSSGEICYSSLEGSSFCHHKQSGIRALEKRTEIFRITSSWHFLCIIIQSVSPRRPAQNLCCWRIAESWSNVKWIASNHFPLLLNTSNKIGGSWTCGKAGNCGEDQCAETWDPKITTLGKADQSLGLWTTFLEGQSHLLEGQNHLPRRGWYFWPLIYKGIQRLYTPSLTTKHLKMDHLKRKVVFQSLFFRGWPLETDMALESHHLY